MASPRSRTSRTDPRVERSRQVVRRAALEELAATGYGAFTIDGVATRSGVARSTIYRHWPDRLALLGDALEVLNEQPAPELTASNPRDRVRELLGHLVDVTSSPTLSRAAPTLVDAAERDPRLRRFHHRYNARRRQALVDAIAAGVDDGDFRGDIDPDLASVTLAGAVFYRRLMTPTPFDADRIDELIDLVLGPFDDRV